MRREHGSERRPRPRRNAASTPPATAARRPRPRRRPPPSRTRASKSWPPWKSRRETPPRQRRVPVQVAAAPTDAASEPFQEGRGLHPFPCRAADQQLTGSDRGRRGLHVQLPPLLCVGARCRALGREASRQRGFRAAAGELQSRRRAAHARLLRRADARSARFHSPGVLRRDPPAQEPVVRRRLDHEFFVAHGVEEKRSRTR